MADIAISHAEDYEVLTVDLGTAHANEKIEIAGRSFSVVYTDGTGTVRFNGPDAAAIPLERISTLDFPGRPIREFYLTNTAQSGKTATILVAGDLGFKVNPGALLVIQDILAGSVGVKGSDGTTLQALRADAYKRLAVQDAPWWLRKYGGRPILLDDMEGTLKWTQENATITKDGTATFVHSGSYALKGVTGATAGNVASAYWRGHKPKTTADRYISLGVHFALIGALDTTPRSFELQLRIADGTNYWYGVVRYLHYVTTSQKKLVYLNSSNAQADITGGAFPTTVTEPVWHCLELMLKRTASGWEYKRVTIDGVDFDLSGVAMYSPANAENPNYFVRLAAVTDAAAATTFYADDFWLLEDMPAVD